MTGAIHKRDLRTGRLWADSPGLGVLVRPLTRAISVDVAVIGAGINGAFMAHQLSKDGSVAVLDRRPPLMGSTVASTALLQWEIDLPLTALAEKIGMAKAKRAYLRSRSAVDALKAIVAEERIVCGLKDKSSLYLAGRRHGPVLGRDRFRGNGITYSVIASQIVAAEVRGGSDPDAELYRAD